MLWIVVFVVVSLLCVMAFVQWESPQREKPKVQRNRHEGKRGVGDVDRGEHEDAGGLSHEEIEHDYLQREQEQQEDGQWLEQMRDKD